MTVEMMIDMLRGYPMDAYVRDTYGSPIFWVSERYGKYKVYLEPVNWVAQELSFDKKELNVKQLIEILSEWEDDIHIQVCDTEGSPILWSSPRYTNKRVVYLESIEDTDIDEELDATFEYYLDENISDNDAAQELKDRGFTIDDLRNYKESVYEWAMQTDVDW